MKRAIFVLVLLTVGVMLPPLYSQWTESQRQKQIQAIKQQARPIVGERLETVLSTLETGEPPAIVILYTRRHAEPSGALRVLSRTIGRASETGFRRGTASETRVFNGARGCRKYL